MSSRECRRPPPPCALGFRSRGRDDHSNPVADLPPTPQSSSSFATCAPRRPLPTREPSFRRRAHPFGRASGKRAQTTVSGTYRPLNRGGILGDAHGAGLTGSALQAEQCGQAALPLYPRRADAFRPDRVPEAPCLPPLCRQAVRPPGDELAARREPGGLDSGHQLSQKVRAYGGYREGTCGQITDTWLVVTCHTRTSMSSASPCARWATSPPSRCRETCSPRSKT